MKPLFVFALCLFALTLPAQLTITHDPSSLVFHSAPGYYDSQTLSLSNTGTVPATYSLLHEPIGSGSSIIGYYPFSGFYEDMITNTGGTINGTSLANDRLSRPQSALRCDGVDDSYTVRPFNLENEFTFSFWACPTTAAPITGAGYYGYAIYSRYLLFPDWGGEGSRGGLGVALGTNGIMLVEHAAGYMPVLLSHSADLSGWKHYTVAFSNHVPYLFIDGAFVTGGLISQKAVTFMSSYFGGGQYGYFKGTLDEIKVWNTVLTAPQIMAEHENSLLDRWSFQPSRGEIQPGMTVPCQVRMIDGDLLESQVADAIMLCQSGIPSYKVLVPATIQVGSIQVPLPPESISLVLLPNGDLQATWQPVTQDTNGSPVTPDLYKVYTGPDPLRPQDYLLAGTTTGTTFTIPGGGTPPILNRRCVSVVAWMD